MPLASYLFIPIMVHLLESTHHAQEMYRHIYRLSHSFNTDNISVNSYSSTSDPQTKHYQILNMKDASFNDDRSVQILYLLHGYPHYYIFETTALNLPELPRAIWSTILIHIFTSSPIRRCNSSFSTCAVSLEKLSSLTQSMELSRFWIKIIGTLV